MTTDSHQTTVTEPETEKPAVESPDMTAAPVEELSDAPTPLADEATTPAEATPVEASAPAEEPTPEPEPVAAAAPEPKPAARETIVEDDANLFDAYMSGSMDTSSGIDTMEGGFKRLAKGDRVEATIVQVNADRVFVDLGTKAEGVVPLHELTDENIESAAERFSVGDRISVVVLKPEGGADNPALVSKKRAEFEEAWDRVEEALKSGDSITAQVVDRVKGGLVVDVGVRGFVPATHVGSGKLRNIEKYVGQTLSLKVLEIDRERKKVVLSNRQAEEERRAEARDTIFTKVKPGDMLEGTVRRLTDYGAFVDLGGVDGLLHISEMSWMRISHPKEMFKEGQKIQVMVLRLDPTAGKLSLGHRQVLPDPWNLIKQNYTPNQRLTVTIGRIVQGGAFVKLPEGAEAFIPVSEMSYQRIKRPQDAVEENQEVEVQVLDLRPDERRMVLSMRAVGGGAARKDPQPYQPGGYEEEYRTIGSGGKPKPAGRKGAKKGGRGGRDFEDDFDDPGRRGFATGGATIGERLGMLKGFYREDEDGDDAKTETAEESADTGEGAE